MQIKMEMILNTATSLGTFFIDKKGSNYCFLQDGYTVLNICSSKFIRKVIKEHKKRAIIKSDDVKGILDHLITLSEENELDYHINKRCTLNNGNIYIDMCNSNRHRIVEISKKDIVVYESYNIPLLESKNNTLALPDFDPSAKIEDLLPLIDKYFYIDESKKLLLAVYIVSLFIEPIQSPILILNGSKGSGKTTCMRWLKELVDPTIDDVSLFPSSERDLAIMLDNSYMVAFDNVSDCSISNNASDMLCVAISGGIKSTRKLYTDGELTYKTLKNKIVMNGIGNLVSKADVLDRSLIISMKRIPEAKRQSIISLEDSFERDIPKFLGSIFKILQFTLKTVNDVDIQNISRLIDFCQYGYAIAEVLEKGNGNKFLKLYQENINELNVTALEENPIAVCIINLMKDKKKMVVSVSELYEKICNIAEINYINRRTKGFPGAPNVLSSRLEEIKSNLEEIGIVYTKKNIGKCKMITLTNLHYTD